MSERTSYRTSFVIDKGHLDVVDDYCRANDLSRSQAIRKGLRLLIGGELAPTNGKPRAPRPKAHRNGSGGP